jgi:hypothetical protein
MWNRDWIIETATRIRELNPEVVLSAGGPEVTADPDGFLKAAPFTFVVSGEGEIPFLEVATRLAAGHPAGQIPGVHSPAGSIPGGQGLADLDEIPSPWLSKTLPADHGVLWELSRGCPFRCDFCYESRGMTGVRRHSVERVRQELLFFKDAGVSQVYLLDPTFNADKKRAKAILRMIAEIAPEIHYTFEVRTEFLDKEMAELFGSLHCAVQIGLQSSHPSVLKNVNRTIDREQFSERVMLLNHAGAVFGLDLIYGMPGDTLEGFRESLDYALELFPNQLDIFALSVLPGTRLNETASDFGLEWMPEPPYRTLNSPGFGPADRKTAAGLARASLLFYSRGRGVAWLIPLAWTLEMKPSKVLEQFAVVIRDKGWMDKDPGEEELEEAQKDFCRRMLQTRKMNPLVPLITDLITFHHAWGRALADGDPDGIKTQGPVGREPDPDRVWRLRKDVKLFVTEHDLYALQECGMVPLEDMAEDCPKSRSFGMAFFGRTGVEVVGMYENCYRVLTALDGTLPLGSLYDRRGQKGGKTIPFLSSMLEEGLLIIG